MNESYEKEIGHYVGSGQSRYANAHTKNYSATIVKFAEDMFEVKINMVDIRLNKSASLILKDEELVVLQNALKHYFENSKKAEKKS